MSKHNGNNTVVAELDSEQARAMLERDKEERGQKAIEAIDAVCKQFRVSLVPRIIIAGNQVQSDIQIVALD